MMDENFYSILKKFFRDRKITQQSIADILGSSNSYVNQLLNGKCSLGRVAAQKLHDAYGLSVAWLLTGEGDMMARGAAVNTINIDARGNRVNASGSAMAVQAVGGSSVMPASPGGDAATVAQLLDQNAQFIKQIDRLTDQNQKLIDLLAASYKNNQ